MSMESLLAAVAQAVLDYLLQETGLAERVRAVLGVDPERRAFRTALASAYAAFARQYPDLVASLFDESFLTREGTPILAQLLTRRGRPDPAELARRWAQHLGHSNPESWPRLTEATRAAADFLTWLEAELAKQPVLQPLWDSRALERIAENTEAIRRALENVLAQSAGGGQPLRADNRIRRPQRYHHRQREHRDPGVPDLLRRQLHAAGRPLPAPGPGL